MPSQHTGTSLDPFLHFQFLNLLFSLSFSFQSIHSKASSTLVVMYVLFLSAEELKFQQGI